MFERLQSCSRHLKSQYLSAFDQISALVRISSVIGASKALTVQVSPLILTRLPIPPVHRPLPSAMTPLSISNSSTTDWSTASMQQKSAPAENEMLAYQPAALDPRARRDSI